MINVKRIVTNVMMVLLPIVPVVIARMINVKRIALNVS